MIVIRKFGAEWCKNCKELEKALYSFFDLVLKDKTIALESIDIDEDDSHDDVTKLPTIHILVDGKVDKILEGYSACLSLKDLVIPNIADASAMEDF